MRNSTTKKALAFKIAVEQTLDISNCFQPGLQALGSHSSKIALGTTSKCEGSVDIDACVIQKYPTSNRWDYVFSYDGEAFFVEVHSANTGEVSIVLKKLRWLKDWLHMHSPKINALKATSKTPFYWLQSGNFNIPKSAPQFRLAAQAGIKPISKLNLI